MRILVAEQIAKEGLAILEARHQVDVLVGVPREELLAAIPQYDALMVRSQVQADAELIAAGTKLLVIGRAGVGVDNVDLEAATKAGIVVVNAPTGNTIAAAEHTLALLFALSRHIVAGEAAIRRGEWKLRSKLVGMELRGKTIGIVGLGKIGQAIAERARGMEMTVIGSDPFVTAEQAAIHGIELVSFEDLLPRADIITVHVPITRGTRGLIGAEQIQRMRRGAILLNVARGGVIDEAAAAAALTDGQLGGAAFDVFDPEPPSTDGPLFSAPNVLLTPHLGASTAEAQVAVALEAAEQIVEVLEGRPARYAVNSPLVTPETAQAIAPYLPLAEILGRVYGQFARQAGKSLTLEVAGELAAHNASPLVAAMLRGLLEHGTNERVNQVNAVHLAKSRGIAVEERKTTDAGAYASLVTVSGKVGGRVTTVSGTVAAGEPRIVRLDDYAFDMEPTPHMLLTRHRDRPGTMGRIGSLVGKADVNISGMSLGRSKPRAEALMLLALDEDVPDSLVEAIKADEAVLDVWAIRTTPEA